MNRFSNAMIYLCLQILDNYFSKFQRNYERSLTGDCHPASE